jgi:hypothetical protein
MTRRFVLILVSIAFSVPTQAQWLTKADESPSARSQRHNAPRVSEGVEHDAGIGDAFKWYWGQRTFGLGYIPKGALQSAVQQRDAMRQASGKGMTTQSIQQPPWTLVGPVNIGGRVNAIAINPYNPSTVFIGAANGGVWKTMDAGTTWTPLTDQLQSVSMGSLAIDPNDTNIVFAGTGELPSTEDSYAGYGLLRSTDGGMTWSDVGSSNVGAYSRVIVNPKHSNIIYAAAGRSGGGVLRSIDGGNSWNWLAGGLPPQGASVCDLALSMNGDVAVLYAGIVGHGVFQSMDGGDSWTELNPFPQIDSATDMLRISLDVDPTNWQNVVVLDVSTNATNSNGNIDDLGGLMVSNDGGNTWTDAGTQFENGDSPFVEGGTTPPQGWYDVYVRVDPSNFNHMLFGGVHFYSSNDGGGSWSEYGGMHPDHHDAMFAPSNHNIVYVGCDGGVYFSSTGGNVFSGATFPIPITQFYGIGIDQTKSDVTYGGTQDNGTLSGSTGSDWSGILGGDGTLTQVDPKTPSIVYDETPQSFPNPSVFADNGLSPSIDSTVWLDPFAADATNDIIYWGCQRLAYSKNQGQSWTNCKQVFGSAAANTTISSIDAFGDGKTVLVGTGGGIVYLTTNNGTSFTNVSANLPGRAVTWVKFNPSSKTTFYATTSGFGAGHVFKTTNSGMQWTNISSTLPDIPVNTLVMDPQNPTVLYIGTDVGVFFSPNDGGEWMPYGTGLPNTGIDFMEAHVANRVIRAGTHGRSIWQVPLEDDVTGIVLPAQRTLWTLGDSATIQWHGFASPVSLELSEDGGTTWQNVAKGVQDTTYTVQNILYPPTENAIVRVSDGTDSLLSPLFSIAQQKAGNQIATVAELPLYLYDIAYDKDDNVLWGTNFGATEGSTEDEIYKIDPDQGTLLDSVKVGPIINASSREGFTGIKYDPNTRHLFIQQVDGSTSGPIWTSDIYEVKIDGTVVNHATSPAAYGTGIYVKGDTLLVADRMTNQISSAVLPLSSADFTLLPVIDFSDTRSATLGPRGLTYDSKLGEYLLAYTDFVGSVTSATLNASYLLFLNPDSTPVEQNAFAVTVGEAVANVRGMEYDPRGAGNTAWMTVLNSGNSSQIIKIALTDGPSSAPEAVLTLQPSTVDFGKLDTGKTMTLPVEIHNTGTAADTITAISIAPSGSPFSLEGTTFPVILLPGGSITDSITFAPHSGGEQSANLSITSNQDNPVATFQITGNATINGAGVAPDAAAAGWGLELSPNPASDYVNVTLDAAAAEDAQIRIFDVTGREVSTIPLGMLSMGEHETELSTAGIPNGIYFVRVIATSGEVAATRLAITR